MRTNLVIAFYFGPRIGDTYRNCAPVNDKEYITKQMTMLAKVEHRLAQITCVVAVDLGSLGSLTEIPLISFPTTIKNTPVVVLYRKNEGLSFGSWKYAVETYKNSFDYYIFTEDDYVFVHNGFDTILTNALRRTRGCEFFVVYKNQGQCISIGVISAETLQRKKWLSRKKFRGRLDKNECTWTESFNTQSFQGQDGYMCPYYTRLGRILFYTNDTSINDQHILLAPTEMITLQGELVYPKEIIKVTTRADVIKALENENKPRDEYC